MRHQWLNHRIQIAFHDERKIIESQFDPMIGHAILREVIGSDPFVALAGPNLRFALGRVLGIFLGHFAFQQTRPQNCQSASFVLLLRSLVGTAND